MLLSLTQASKQSGKSKSVLSGAIKSGRLSATRNDKNHYQIDTSELFRVYPKASPEPVLVPPPRTTEKNETAPQKEPLERKLLQQQITSKDEVIVLLKSQLEEIKEREKELLCIVKNQTLLLTHEKEQNQQKQPAIKRGWLGRIKR